MDRAEPLGFPPGGREAAWHGAPPPRAATAKAGAGEGARARLVAALAAALILSLLAALLWTGPSRAEGRAASTAAPDAPLAAEEVVVGWFPLPPYVVATEHGPPSGFAAEVLSEAARDAGLRPVFRALSGPGEALEAVREGRVQALALLGVADERRDVVAYTRPFLEVRTGLFADAEAAERLAAARGAGDLGGARVGYQAGAIGRVLAEGLPGAEPTPVVGFANLMEQLSEGDLDAVVLVDATFDRGVFALKRRGLFARVGPWLRVTPIALAVDRRLPALAQRLDHALEGMQSGGRLAEIEARWFGPPAPWWTPARIGYAAAAVLGVALALGAALLWRVRERERAGRLAEARRFGAEQARLAEALAFKNAELESRSRDIERLLYVVSHDLKSPLVSIGGFARRLDRHLDQAEPDKARAASERISRNVQAMSELIEGILRLGRAGAGAAQLDWVEVDAVADMVGEALSSRLERARARLLVMRPMPVVRADPVLLRQALQNLVENALRYGCPEPGMTVEIVSRSRGGLVEIGVRDEGPGVPEKDQERIFDLYRRGLGTAEAEEGSGLGLATVRKIAERHGGRVSVSSRPGAGATFWIGFPVGPDVALAAHAAQSASPEPRRSFQANPFAFAAPDPAPDPSAETAADASSGPAPRAGGDDDRQRTAA
ncbi:transporter substrate-binding domain-containing protein [Albimonas sp. CAU 1670]|uniref:sensor histidine kinase n=1 Tax=Albimonas sp. CAU 1670 TaxID=3032599 RepID=UPI0023DC591D|nr:ATP-binding protein [Albimonas sp. CAU 1670]MDF2232143.1 transporter substrate-binding domain-containing protein [Albimonas sp. CAU 1670]